MPAVQVQQQQIPVPAGQGQQQQLCSTPAAPQVTDQGQNNMYSTYREYIPMAGPRQDGVNMMTVKTETVKPVKVSFFKLPNVFNVS